MKIDTNKSEYDELHILAADARASRRRSNVMTTGLIVGGMIAASVYVSTTNDQVDQLADENKTLKSNFEELRQIANAANSRVQQLELDRNSLISQRDNYRESAERIEKAAQNLKLSDAVAKLSLNVPAPRDPDSGSNVPDSQRKEAAAQLSLANIVWVVEGSRRFPMADGDILWIPEAGFSIRYESDTADGKTHKLIRYKGKSVAAGDGEPLESPPLAATSYAPYRETVTAKGSANCIEITLHDKSIRPGFTNENYVDIEVNYVNLEPEDCVPARPK